MKKMTLILTAGFLALSLAACGAKQEEAKEETGVEIASAEELLTKTWEAIPEDKSFFVIGGDSEHFAEGKPGKIDLTKAEENGLENTMCYPLSAVEYVDDAASLIHGMVSNGFTAGAYHVTESSNVQTVADAVKEKIVTNRWMCGFPEEVTIASVGDYVVSVFGYADNLDAFQTALTEVYGDAVTVLVDQPIEE